MSKPLKWIIGVVCVILLGFALVKTNVYWTQGSKIVRVTGVTSKRMKVNNRVADTYLVFTTDETYMNIDSPAYLKFNSSDIQGKLVMSGCFKIKYYGFRIPIFSMYKNIIKAERTDCPAGV